MSKYRRTTLTPRPEHTPVPVLRAGDSTGELYELLSRRHLILGEAHSYNADTMSNLWKIKTAAGIVTLAAVGRLHHMALFAGVTYGMHNMPNPKTAGQILDIIVKAIREGKGK